MILQRIKQYIEYKKISISFFEKSIGMSNASFGKSLKNGGAIGTDKLENILKIYTDINIEWLLTGKGEMIVDDQQKKEYDNKDSNQMIGYLEEQVREKDKEISQLNKEIARLNKENGKLESSLEYYKRSKEGVPQSKHKTTKS